MIPGPAHVSDGSIGEASGRLWRAIWQGPNRDQWLAEPKSATDQHRAGTVVHDVIRDAAERQPIRVIRGTGPDDHQVSALRLGRRNDALPGLAGPHQERRLDAVYSRLLYDRQQSLLALRTKLIEPGCPGGTQLASEAEANIDDVHDEQPRAERSTQIYCLIRGSIGNGREVAGKQHVGDPGAPASG